MASTSVNVRSFPLVAVGHDDSLDASRRTLADHLQVLRWSALFAGVLYGISHQSTLKAQQRQNEAKRKYSEQENLITKAKAEYIKKTMPQEKLTAGGDST